MKSKDNTASEISICVMCYTFATMLKINRRPVQMDGLKLSW
jgi:hypothetical protein